MMRLLRSWRDSLLLLVPNNFKLFALVTLKSTLETYTVLARILWYFFLFPLFIFIQQSYFGKQTLQAQLSAPLSLTGYIITGALYLFTATWITCVFCLATRPSIGKKTLLYFNARGSFLVMLACVAVAVWQLCFWVHWYFSAVHTVLTSELALTQIFYIFILADLIPTAIFFILFFLDSDGGIKQLLTAEVRAVKMTVYNAPLLLILGSIIALPIFTFFKLVTFLQWPGYAFPLLYIFLLKPLIINIWTNIYIKRLHEMPDLYFNQPE